MLALVQPENMTTIEMFAWIDGDVGLTLQVSIYKYMYMYIYRYIYIQSLICTYIYTYIDIVGVARDI